MPFTECGINARQSYSWKKSSQTGFPWMHLGPVCSGWAHACVCPPVRPSVRCVGAAASVTLSLFIKALLPGNRVAWQHECGSPRGDFTQTQKGEKTGVKRKGRTLVPRLAFHLLAFICMSLQCYNIPAFALFISGYSFWRLQLGKHIKNSLQLYSETHMTPSQAMSQCHLSCCSISPCQPLNVAAVARCTCSLHTRGYCMWLNVKCVFIFELLHRRAAITHWWLLTARQSTVH